MAKEEKDVKSKEDKKAAKAAKKEEKKKAKAAKKAAKKNGEDVFENEEEEGSSKLVILLTTVIIIIVWLAILGLIIKADVGGFGTNVMRPILKDIPYVNKILPASDDTSSMGSLSSEEESSYDTLDEALARIKELELELQDMNTKTDEYKAKIKEYKAETKRLKEFEENQKKFEEEKLKFDQEVVFSDNAPDIEEYKSYYESIDPTNAELIYKEVIQQQQADEDMDNYVSMYSSMKASEAAKIFDTMTDHLDLVAQILKSMDADTSSAILGKMNADTAAKLTVLMDPQE